MSVKSVPEDINYVLCNNNKFVRELNEFRYILPSRDHKVFESDGVVILVTYKVLDRLLLYIMVYCAIKRGLFKDMTALNPGLVY